MIPNIVFAIKCKEEFEVGLICTNEILASLGKMYVTDERFKNNIDKHSDGTAMFVSEAIEVYCSN